MSLPNKCAVASEKLAVYFHWPFCLSKCPYCDFNSHVSSNINHDHWRRAFLAEIRRMASWIGGRNVTSIFFGGGTPSLMAPKTVAAILDEVAKQWTVDERPEITLEANPTSSDSATFRDFHSAGINRLSLGIQALQDDALKFLGRTHSAAEGLIAAEIGASVFSRISIDLIYGRPKQSTEDWHRELKSALELVDDHISVYQLTIEKGTPFYDLHRRGTLELPTDKKAEGLYETTQKVLNEAGLPSYEISNHARPGGESRHNLAYWRYQDYLGIGPGAHSRIVVNSKMLAIEQFRTPKRWLQSTEQETGATLSKTALSQAQSIQEMVMMGLRLKNGLNKTWFEDRTGVKLVDAINFPATMNLESAGLIINQKEQLRLTPLGLMVLNSVLAKILI